MNEEQNTEPMTSQLSEEETNKVNVGVGTNKQQGRVKWFNNRAGYGFLTALDGADVFAHHSGIQVDTEQYKYLVQGEYVEFEKCKSKNDKHPWQATDIRGIGGGQLMCETRFDQRPQRRDQEAEEPQRVRRKGGGPREGNWKLSES